MNIQLYVEVEEERAEEVCLHAAMATDYGRRSVYKPAYGPIYILDCHQTKDIFQGTGPYIDKLAPGGDIRSDASKIQQYNFPASLLNFSMDL